MIFLLAGVVVPEQFDASEHESCPKYGVAVRVGLPQNLGDLSVDELRRSMRSVKRANSILESCAHRLRSELSQRARSDRSVDLHHILRSDGGMTGRQASQQADIASRAHNLAHSETLLSSGELTPNHFAQLARGQKEVPGAFVQHEMDLTEAAKSMSPDRFSRHVSRWIAEQQDDDGEGRFNRLRQKRYLQIQELDSGMYQIRGEVDPEAGSAISTVLTAVANDFFHAESRNSRPRSSPPQRLADALTACVRHNGGALLDGVGLPGRAVLHVALSYDLLCDRLGELTDSPTAVSNAGRPGGSKSARGFSQVGISTTGTPLSPATIRRLACDADIIPTVLGGHGVVLDQGRRRRTATGAQRSALVQRDQHCVFPDCDRPPSWCQIHHLMPWEAGGPSDLDNLAMLCSSHHHLVHEGGWSLRQPEPGIWEAHPPPERSRRPGVPKPGPGHDPTATCNPDENHGLI